MAPLFGKKDNADEDRRIAENMQNLSNQIGELQQKLNQRNQEYEKLQTELRDARTKSEQSGANAQALKDAQSKIQDLQRQLSQASANQQATSNADLQAAQAKINALEQQLSQLKTASASTTEYKTSSIAAGGLAVGGQAWVTRAGGLPLRLRSAPNLQGNVLDRLQPGTQMTLLDGPQQSDGHAWWHIRASDGREGWVAGEDLRTQAD